MTDSSRYPVHESVDVIDGETIYENDEWQKAVVLYQYGTLETLSPELAVYLWHKQEKEWKRKQKYVVRTVSGWEEDKGVIDEFLPALNGDDVEGDIPNPDERLPVSDYYHVSEASTIFRTEEWWKAATVIDAKGSYETTELILYVWQRTQDGWKTRQKYPIKREKSWEEESSTIEKFLVDIVEDSTENSMISQPLTSSTGGESNKEILKNALERRHLSERLTD